MFNNNDRIERRDSRFLQSPHCAANCLTTRTLKWLGRNVVQITYKTSSANHVCHVVQRDSSAIKFDRVEISPILVFFTWLTPLNDDGGEVNRSTRRKPLTTSFRKCYVLKNPKFQAPTRTRTLALMGGLESRRANHYTTRFCFVLVFFTSGRRSTLRCREPSCFQPDQRWHEAEGNNIETPETREGLFVCLLVA